MNRGITKEDLLLILPRALTQDKSVVALAEVDAEALAARPAEIDKARVIANIDGLDEAVLDILAHDFKVDWWDPEYSVEEKRRTLKSSWRVHKTFGTKAAAERAVTAVYSNARIYEWFEYGGEPHHFKVKVWGEDRPGFEQGTAKVFRLVSMVKRLSSWLDEIVLEFDFSPFVETTGHLIFRRFAMAWTFQSPHDRMALGISRLQIAPYRFPHFSDTVRFDGSTDFDGGITFDQTYGALGFPSFRMNSKFRKPKERLHTPSFRGAGTARVTNRGGDLDLLRFTYTASLKHSENLSGKITMENWYALNGEFDFDGSKIFNAYIKEEEL